MPFDFDPFSLDFPALTLQCLDPPPTLFATTQYPTPTSWSISPPGQTQLEALHAYFRGEFKRWKTTCALATTAVTEELVYPPPLNPARIDCKAEVLKAEKAAEQMEKHVYDHLAATYSIWNGLAPDQREQLWRLELARGVSRKQKEVDKLKEGQDMLRQENKNLKTQIEQLTRLQQPREFKIAPPSTIYVDEKLMGRMLEQGMVNRQHLVGFNIADRHTDLNTIVSSVVDRWKSVIVSTRLSTGGLQTQRPLHAESTEPSPRGSVAEVSPSTQHHPSQQRQQSFSNYQNLPPPRQSYPPSATSPATSLTPQIPSTPAIPSAAPSISIQGEEDDEDEEMSDQDAEPDPDPNNPDDGDAEGDTDADADADMDDVPSDYTDAQLQPLQQQLQQQLPHQGMQMPTQQMGRLEVSRTREQMGSGRRSVTDDGIAGHGGLG